MNYFIDYFYWLIAGSALVLLEFFIPGLVVIFLGLGALATSGMLYLGYIRDPYLTVVFFTLTSIFMLATIRRVVKKFYPSDSEKVESDEDKILIGQEAITISTISPDNFEGRVKYSGTTWPAKSKEGDIAEATLVEIVGRENINFIVRRKENRAL
ncbi:MAG TPA: NfeD family protein [Turneriella sp.]|nr:NfeD family protein [Turneriella sp.]